MRSDTATTRRPAKGGVLVVGGGFGGATVARFLGRRGATVVNSQNSMLFTPMLPRCRRCDRDAQRHDAFGDGVPVGRGDRRQGDRPGPRGRRAEVQTDGGLNISLEYDHVVIAVGAVPRTFPITGLIEHAVGCTTVLDALYLRNQVLRLLAAAAIEPDPERRTGLLTFVFIGGGYAGVEALAELHHLAEDALRYHPSLRGLPQRWVLVDAAPKILAEIPSELGRYVNDRLGQRGIDVRLNTRLVKVVDGRVTLSDGTEMDTGLLVWTAGMKADPIVAHFGLPLDDRGRVRVGPTLQVDGRQNVWALGDCAVGAERRQPRPGRSSYQPARHTPGPPLDCQSRGHARRRHAASLPVPLPRPGGHARARRGDRRHQGGAPHRPARVAGSSRCPSHAGPDRISPPRSRERLGAGAALPAQPRHPGRIDRSPSTNSQSRPPVARFAGG